MTIVLGVLTGVFYLLTSLILPMMAYAIWKQGRKAGFVLLIFINVLWFTYLGMLLGAVIG